MTSAARNPATWTGGVAAVVRSHRRALGVAAGAATLTPLLELTYPWPLALAVDHVLDGRPFTGALSGLDGLGPGAVLAVCAGAVLVLAAAGAVVDRAAVLRSERAAERISSDLRRAVFDRTLTLPARFHDRHHSGELVSRLTSDVGRVLDAVTAATLVVLADGVLVAGTLVVLVLVAPDLALVALLVVPPLALVAVLQRRRVRAVQRVARTETGRLAAVASDLLGAVRIVQVFNRGRAIETRFRVRDDALLTARLDAVAVEARWAPRADLVLAAGTAATLLVGVTQARSSVISTGTLLLAVTYVHDLYRPIRSLAKLAGTFAKASASAERLGHVLDQPAEPAHTEPLRTAPPVTVGAGFQAVRFGHDPDRPVLDGLDLWLPAGLTTAVTGPSGCGKTTLLHLLLRLYEPDAGTVALDGVDVRVCSAESLRARVAYVPQDPWLVTGTIAENIAFGGRDVTRAAVVGAARAAGVLEFAQRLPLGVDAPVGEGGRLLSGGQQRRVAIARAVVAGAPLLLVDEPTAGLDPVAADTVVRALARAGRGRTTVVVTHDPAVLAAADLVVDLGAVDHPVRSLRGEEVNTP